MKIAVCISGILNTGKHKLINDRIKEKFPSADFYYATWESQRALFEKKFPNDICTFYHEPEMSYHPYFDISKHQWVTPHYKKSVEWAKKKEHTGNSVYNWTIHHTKQLLIHSWEVNKIQNDYDVIVRTRFDSVIFSGANFTPYIHDTYKNNRSNGFGGYEKKFDNLVEIRHVGKYQRWEHRLADFLIIHPANMINADKVNEWHNNHILHGAEHGWWQILDMNHGSRHRNFFGWVMADKYLDGNQK